MYSPRLICVPCHRPWPRSCHRRNILRSTRCYQPPRYGQQHGQFGQRYGQLYGQQLLQYQQEAWEDSDVKEEWERDRIPPPPPQYYQQPQPPTPPPQQQQQQPPAPSPPQDEAPVVPEEAAALDDLPIKEEAMEEPKMDTREPGHRCMQNVCRASYLFRTLSRVVSPAPSFRVQNVLYALRAVPSHVPGDRLHVLRVLHSC